MILSFAAIELCTKQRCMEIFSPAKINLTLEILGKRPDGFHELATWMIPIGLADLIQIETAAEASFTCNVPELSGDMSNLIIRAAKLFNDTASVNTAYSIRLHKQIPVGAGLGGGSSNAAATLCLLNQLHGGRFTLETLRDFAAMLGSDVPFFIDGRSAFCTGRGEIMQPRHFARGLWVCLFTPGFAVSTAAAYRAYSRLSGVARRGREIETIWGRLRNDLEQAVFPKYLFLALMKNWLQRQAEAIFALMSGSGSTVFAVVNSRSDGEILRARFADKFGAQTWSTVCSLNPSESLKGKRCSG
jgi:4-diphosphocytidyl-2-C-methyl-D-erythritol kinase